MKGEQYMRVEDVQKIFDVSYWTVLRWARRGELGAFKLGKYWYFPERLVKSARTAKRW